MLDRAALGVNIFVHWKSTPKLSGSLSYFSYHSIHSIHVIYITGQFTPRAQIRMIYCTSIFFCKIGQNVHRATHRYTFTRSPAHLHTYWINLNSFLHFLIYMVCERLLNRVGSLVEELGNGPFLRTQRNRGRTAYVGIWMVNRWITQSGVFLCRLAAVV